MVCVVRPPHPRALALLLLGACRLSAFEDLEGDTRDAAAQDAGHRQPDAGTRPDGGGTDACVRARDLPLALTRDDVVPLATVANPEGVGVRRPGPVAWLGRQRTFLFSSTHLAGSESVDDYASGALQGENPPWSDPQAGAVTWSLAEKLHEGMPLPLMPAAGPDAHFKLVPTSLYRSYEGQFGGTAFVQKVPDSLVPSETWIAHIEDGSTVVSDVVGPLFQAPDPIFSVGAHRGQAYVKVYACGVDPASSDTTPLSDRCFVARAPIDGVETRDRYEAYRLGEDGQGVWDADLTLATPVLYGARNELSVTWNGYLNGYLAVHGKGLDDKLVVQTAPASEGPWTVQGELALPSATGWIYDVRLIAGLGGCDDQLVIAYLSPTELVGLNPVAGTVQLVRVDLR